MDDKKMRRLMSLWLALNLFGCLFVAIPAFVPILITIRLYEIGYIDNYSIIVIAGVLNALIAPKIMEFFGNIYDKIYCKILDKAKESR